MISVPIYIFLFIYFAFLAVFVFYSLVNIYHLVSTGALTMVSFVATFFVSALSVIVLFFTWQFLQNADWQQPITIWNNEWISFNSNLF